MIAQEEGWYVDRDRACGWKSIIPLDLRLQRKIEQCIFLDEFSKAGRRRAYITFIHIIVNLEQQESNMTTVTQNKYT